MIASSLSGLWGMVLLGVGNHLWQSTLFAAVAGLLTLMLRKNHARIRYCLWLAASLKFLVPFSLLVFLGSQLTWLQHRLPHHDVGATAGSYLLIEDISQPFTKDMVPWVHISPPAIGVVPSMLARISALLSPIPLLPAFLVAVWLCGSMLVLGLWTSRWLKIRSALRKALPMLEGREVEVLRRVERLVGLRRKIELRLLPAYMEPGIFGMTRPVLLWPQAISARLEDAHLEAVLAHEVWHVRRRDNLTAAAHMLVEAIFWFHPLLWWLELRLVEERESACDEEISLLCGQPHIYAESILKVCEFCVESPLACVSGITGADLKRRIRSIMFPPMARLTLARRIMLAVFAIVSIAAPFAFGIVRMIPFYGQILRANGPMPSFDVATIRPSDPLNSHESISVLPGGTLNATTTTKTLIERAYGIRDFQLVGGPKWLDSVPYTIVAKSSTPVDPRTLKPEQQNSFYEGQMLRIQSLLADRFHLKVHTTTKEMPVFALVVAKGGPKLHTPKPGEAHRLYSSGPGRLACYGASMSELADELPDDGVTRIVVDRTGLTGRYDFWINWTPDEISDGAPGNSGPSIFTAMQEQLGLKLVPTRGPAEVLVIDHIEPPSAN
jgi:bla regulator protein blaR1